MSLLLHGRVVCASQCCLPCCTKQIAVVRLERAAVAELQRLDRFERIVGVLSDRMVLHRNVYLAIGHAELMFELSMLR